MNNWIEWHGQDNPPVSLTTRVDIKMREGGIGLRRWALTCGWKHRGWWDDVIAYRLSK